MQISAKSFLLCILVSFSATAQFHAAFLVDDDYVVHYYDRAHHCELSTAEMIGRGALALAGAAAIAYGLNEAHKNYIAICAVAAKYDVEHAWLENKVEGATRFYNWGYRTWDTAYSIDNDKRNVVLCFCTDLALTIRNSTKQQDLVIHDAFGNKIDNPTWQDVLDAMSREKEAIAHDVHELEKNYLVYFNSLPSWPAKPFGITRDYTNVCAQEGCNPKAPGSWATKELKFKRVDAGMKGSCSNRWWHYFCKLNYGNAAEVWWNIFKLYQRLMVLEAAIKEITAGYANEPIRDYNPAHQELVVMTKPTY